ncbi:DUF1573 domain-containing protein [Prevotella sp. OH937_COT-195]|uniref:DUF1573 domain-containing protein n=1 Tax=Prevotella sp. OH937_COT-195 TaxID=2491051 RepID=UPI000F652AAF|nr:DUF1573 domain-containing protein [Prevotella sp. OH937_COT-195]RRD02272.1 DUF1573 domain-containing protein [Prevotella sp. OH937_COT-195]
MNNRFIIATIMAIAARGGVAQEISAEHQVVDCGGVKFEQPVTVNFQLKNKGLQLRISKVHPDCGCTAVNFPRQPIGDGESFVISATYDARQLGHFSKQLAVYSNASQKPYFLTIKGVVAVEDISYKGDFSETLGSVRADVNHVEFDDVNRGEMPVKRIHIINTGREAVSPVVMHLPEYLMANVSPTTIPAGKQGEVLLTLKSNKLPDFGLTQTSVFLGMKPGDKVSRDKEIEVSVVLLPAFNELTEEQLRNAPQLRMDNNVLELGKFGRKKKKSGVITLENIGKSELEVSSLQMFTAGLSVQLSKRKLKPGEKTTLKITAEAKAMKNLRTEPRVLMITNDPKNAKVIVSVKVEK